MEEKNIANSRSDRDSIQTCDPVKLRENSALTREGVSSVAPPAGRAGLAKEGYKKTKLGWIPEDWKECNFGSLADKKIKWSITGGPFGSNLKVSDYSDTGVRIIQLQNIGDGEFKDNYEIYTSEQKADELLACNIYPDEIILSKMGDPVARACIMPSGPNRYLMASDGIRLVVDERKYNKHFVLNYLNYKIFRNLAISHSTGSTRQRIGLNDLKKLPFVKPPLLEQQKIATILSTWDRAIAKQEQLIIAKQEFKKGLMQLLLTGKKRFEGFEGEWERIKLGDLGELVGGGTPSTKDPDFWNGEIPWISSSDLGQNNLFDLDISRFISQEAIEKSATKLIPAHSILIVSRVGVGKVAINNQDICTSQDFTSLIPNRGDLIFLGYKIQSIIGSLISHNQGTSIKGFTKKSLENLKFKIPLIKEQQRISSVLSAADKEIGLLQSELATLRGQKRGLMQRLLTGEVRVEI